MHVLHQVCPRCGAERTAAVAEGLCPACLFAAVLADDAPEEDESPDAVRFGDFVIIGKIARGGAGVVYRARQRSLGRIVALKIISGAEADSADFLERFRIEAEAVASLDHPHIVAVHAFGEQDGQYFLAMQFMAGGSLARRDAEEKRAAFSPEAAAGLVATVARAVHHAHQRGILHRDIKPANILLDAAGEPHLADFGLAKLIGRDSAITRTATVMGTPSYMSPEQAAGHTREITTAADVYGLGAVLYDLLTGGPPFAGETTLATVRAVLEDDPVRPSLRAPAVDRDLETICLKCLEKNPTARYGSAEALADDLDRWRRREPILARPLTATERLGRWARRHRARAALLATALIALLVVAVVSSWMNVRLVAARGVIAAQDETRRQELRTLHLSTGQRLAEEGEPFAALESFAEGARLDAGDAARMAMHRLRFAVTLANAPQLERQLAHPAGVRSAAFNASGDRILTACVDGQARVWDAATGELAGAPIAAGGPLRWAGFSPDGALIATRTEAGAVQLHRSDDAASVGASWPARPLGRADYLRRREVAFSRLGRWLALPGEAAVAVLDFQKGEAGRRTFPVEKAVNHVFFSPDETQLAVLTEAGMMEVREVETWREIHTIADPSKQGRAWRNGAWSPDGTKLALADDWKFAGVYDARSGQALTPRLAHGGFVYGCEFRADSRALVTWSEDNTARLFDVQDGRPLCAPLRHPGRVWATAFSADGRRLATASGDDSARLWDGATGERLGARLPHGGPVREVSFSADGERVLTASSDGGARVWKIPAAGFARWSWPQGSAVNGVVFSPDGRFVASIGINTKAQVWDCATGAPAGPVLEHPARAYDLAWLDDRRLATTCGDGKFRVWEIPTGRVLSTAPMPAEPNGKFDGPRFVAHPPGEVPGCWEPEQGRRIATFPIQPKERVWPGMEGKMFTAILGARVRVAGAGVPEWAVNIEGPVTLARLDPTGKRMAVSYSDGRLQIHERATGQRLVSLSRHAAPIRHLLFTSDGRVLATGSDDGTLRLWDAATGEPLGAPLVHPDRVIRVAIRPDGRALATACTDGFARYWEIPPDVATAEEMRKIARRLSGRAE